MRYIEWDLQNNPDFFRKPQSGRYIDSRVMRHVVANVNKPETVSEADFTAVLEAVAGEIDLIPDFPLKAHLISPAGLQQGDSVWFEAYAHSTGKYFVLPCTVAWKDAVGFCFADPNDYGHYGRVDDYNMGRKRTVFGWRCWDICPTDERREAVPWKS